MCRHPEGMQEVLGHRFRQGALSVNISKSSLPSGLLKSERRSLVQTESCQQKPPGALTWLLLKPDDRLRFPRRRPGRLRIPCSRGSGEGATCDLMPFAKVRAQQKGVRLIQE